jgi:3-deoxy-manno-octulosonate cytidylyltransferase (CMP-KDO synthetase)
LANIAGKKMIEWVYDQCVEEITSNEILPPIEISVVTDHDEIEHTLKDKSRNVCRVDDNVSTGSERIYLAWQRYYKDQNFDYIINVQGDEPLINKQDLLNLLEFHQESNFDITTYVNKSKVKEDFENPNCVKALLNEKNGECHYFSRAPIPFHRDSEFESFYHHIGIYCYKTEALEKFFNAEKSTNEVKESLEQLRALDLGMRIGAMITKKKFIGVDTPEDIYKLEGVLGEE